MTHWRVVFDFCLDHFQFASQVFEKNLCSRISEICFDSLWKRRREGFIKRDGKDKSAGAKNNKNKRLSGQNCWLLLKDSEQGQRFARRANQKWRINKEHKNGGHHRSCQWKQRPEKAWRKVFNASRGKRTETTQRGEVPEKKAKTVAPLNVMISTNLLGSGSYGCCYLASYKGMEVVSKNFVVRVSRGKTHGQAEDRVCQEASLRSPHN